MRDDLAWRGPAQLAARLCLRRSIQRAGTEEVNEEMKAARGHASDLVERDRAKVGGAIARLLEELAPRGVLETLVPLHVPPGQKPRASERTGCLFDDQHAPSVINARDDRTHARALGHARYGFLVGVGKGGSVPIGNVVVGVGPGVRVGTGVRVGVGDAEGVGHGSGPTRFHVYRP